MHVIFLTLPTHTDNTATAGSNYKEQYECEWHPIILTMYVYIIKHQYF
jgi:hypothetical protein